MNILVVGGTRFMGVHLVQKLLADGHDVTIATRGKTPDPFGDTVSRINLERTSESSIARALKGKAFDVVYDSQAYSSNEIKFLLDAVDCGRYIEVSTASVYVPNLRLNMPETDFDPLAHPLKWCNRGDFPYDELKRQAECAIFQTYSRIPSVAVRIPLVVCEDDYTKRLYSYIEHIVQSKPMFVDNPQSRMNLIMSHDAGNFLAWLADKDFCGSINAANAGDTSLAEIIDYTERECGKTAIITEDGKAAALNGQPDYGLDLSKVEGLGYQFPALQTRLPGLLSGYIETARRAYV